MKTRRQQSGITVLAALGLLVILGFFVMCIIRMTPPYFEYISVKEIVSGISLDPETQNLSIGSIRRKIDANFNTNQIYALNSKSVEIYRKKGSTYIDAGYEVRIPLFWRIDAMLNFNDLIYRVGEGEPVSAEIAAKK